MFDGFSSQADNLPYELPHETEQMKTIAIPVEKKHHVYLLAKRFFDVLLSITALIVLFPLMLLTAICIKAEDGGPVFYNQLRAGKNGKAFRFYKFRSMYVNADQKLGELKHRNESDGPTFKISNDPRITRVGRFIRKASIDELPQLFNIIHGEMSIVGPRPPLLNEVAQYTPEQLHRLDVQPGLTCYWQCSGRSNLSFDKWMELDMKYIRECSLWTDFKIILLTIPAVLTGRGAY
jgi:exopolysaccharide biosynthesis polyprenyl glycosylphosphotransferase